MQRECPFWTGSEGDDLKEKIEAAGGSQEQKRKVRCSRYARVVSDEKVLWKSVKINEKSFGKM